MIKLIHLIWIGTLCPNIIQYCINSIIDSHTDCEIYLWTERGSESIFSFVHDKSRTTIKFVDEYYDKMVALGKRPNRMMLTAKCDILRYMILYDYGGLYLDADVYCFKNLFDEFIQYHQDQVIATEGDDPNIERDRPSKSLFNSHLYAPTVNHVIFKEMIDTVVDIPNSALRMTHGIAGPDLVIIALKSKGESVTLIPREKYFEMSIEESRDMIRNSDKLVYKVSSKQYGLHLSFEFISKYHKRDTPFEIHVI